MTQLVFGRLLHKTEASNTKQYKMAISFSRITWTEAVELQQNITKIDTTKPLKSIERCYSMAIENDNIKISKRLSQSI